MYENQAKEDAIKHFYHDNVTKIVEELYEVQLKLIEGYEKFKVYKHEISPNSVLSSYGMKTFGLKVDDYYVFQLDGVLPHIPKSHVKHYNNVHHTMKGFVCDPLALVLGKMKPKKIDGQVAVMVVHYHSGNDVFDMDNKEKSIIINTLKGVLFKNDSAKILAAYSEEYIETDEEKDRTMVYIGPKNHRFFMCQKFSKTYARIENRDGVFSS